MRRKNGTGQNVKNSISTSRCFYFSKYLAFFSFLMLSLTVFSQEKGGWSLKGDYNGILVYTQTDEFHDEANGLHYEYVLLKFHNTTAKDKKVTVIPDLYYNGVKVNHESMDVVGSIFFLSTGESRTGSVEEKSPAYLKVFSRFLNYSDKPVLTGFELNINTEDL